MSTAWTLLILFFVGIALMSAILIFVRSTVFSISHGLYIIRQYPFFVTIAAILACASVIFMVVYPLSIPVFAIPYIIFALQMYDYSDEQVVGSRIGEWFSKKERRKFKVTLHQGTHTTVSDMKKFLLMLHGIYSNLSQKDIRVEGKYYEDFVIEIVAQEGVCDMYIILYSSSVSTFISAASLYLPTVQFVEVPETPVDTLPDEYAIGTKFFKHIDLGEFSIFNKEIFPTKVYEDLEHARDAFVQNPITQLFDYLVGVKEGDMVVLQCILQPQDARNMGRYSQWKTDFDALRKDLLSNSSVSVSKDGSVSQLTPSEMHVLASVEQKMGSLVFDSKVRFALFGRNSTGKKYLGGIMTYLKQFATDNQGLIPKVKSWVSSDNASWGSFVDALYFKPEENMRKIKFYKGLISRSKSTGGPSFLWDIHSLAAMIHIPMPYAFSDTGNSLNLASPSAIIATVTHKVPETDSMQHDIHNTHQLEPESIHTDETLTKGLHSFRRIE